MRNISPEMRIAVTELVSDPEIELFEIDLTHIDGIRYRFYNDMNSQRPLIGQKQVYEPYPVSGEGFTYSGKGPSGRLTITLSNLFGLIIRVLEDGSIIIETCHRQHAHLSDRFQNGWLKEVPPEGERIFCHDGEPYDLPESTRLDVRIEMPQGSVWEYETA